MIIYVVRVLENLLEKFPKVSYITLTDLSRCYMKDDIHYEVVDEIECEDDEAVDELIYIQHDIASGVYD